MRILFKVGMILLALLWLMLGASAHWHVDIYCEEGVRQDSTIYHVGDGWHYHLNREDEDQERMYFLCVLHKTHGCSGRAIFRADRGFKHSQVHNGHEADRLYPSELDLRRRILARCRSLEYTPFSTILREERQRFSPLVAARITLAGMRTAMRNARISNYPPIPDSLMSLTDLLRDPGFASLTMTEDGLDNIYAGSVTDSGGDHHIILASRRQLLLMSRMTLIFSDGTFKIVPSINSLRNRRAQIFTILSTWRGHTIPLAWVIMECRTQAAYTAVLTLIRNLLPGWRFTRVIADDEAAQTNAWHSIFQPQRVQNCLWHICRAFVSEIMVLGLGAWLLDEQFPEFRTIVRMALHCHFFPLGFCLWDGDC